MAQGLFEPDHIHAELGEIVAGRRPGRKSPETVTLFKSVGVAIQDLAAADHVLQRARQLGLGTEVPGSSGGPDFFILSLLPYATAALIISLRNAVHTSTNECPRLARGIITIVATRDSH